MIADLDETLLFISDILKKKKIPFVLIGGMTLAVWAEIRATKDVDLTITVDGKKWDELCRALDREKVEWIRKQAPSGEAIPDLAQFFWKGRRVDLQTAKTPYQDEIIRRGVKKKLKKKNFSVATPEDVFVLKLLADRTIDLADLENLLRHNPSLDFAYIRKWCRDWEIEERLDQFLQKMKKE